MAYPTLLRSHPESSLPLKPSRPEALHRVAQLAHARQIRELEERATAQARAAEETLEALERRHAQALAAALAAERLKAEQELRKLREEASKSAHRLVAEERENHAAELARLQRLLGDAKADAAREARRREAQAIELAKAIEARFAGKIAPLEQLVREQHEEIRRLRTKGAHDEGIIAKLQRRIKDLLAEIEELTRVRERSPPRARRVGGGFEYEGSPRWLVHGADLSGAHAHATPTGVRGGTEYCDVKS